LTDALTREPRVWVPVELADEFAAVLAAEVKRDVSGVELEHRAVATEE
jgi:hypothetical protein